MLERDTYKNRSNNPHNPNKNICGLAVATTLGVSNNVNYLHTMDDIVRAARTKFTTRSRLSRLGKKKSIGACRAKLEKIATPETVGFLIGIAGHVLLVDAQGETITDTDPRQRDRRAITELFIIERKA